MEQWNAIVEILGFFEFVCFDDRLHRSWKGVGRKVPIPILTGKLGKKGELYRKTMKIVEVHLCVFRHLDSYYHSWYMDLISPRITVCWDCKSFVDCAQLGLRCFHVCRLTSQWVHASKLLHVVLATESGSRIWATWFLPCSRWHVGIWIPFLGWTNAGPLSLTLHTSPVQGMTLLGWVTPSHHAFSSCALFRGSARWQLSVHNRLVGQIQFSTPWTEPRDSDPASWSLRLELGFRFT